MQTRALTDCNWLYTQWVARYCNYGLWSSPGKHTHTLTHLSLTHFCACQHTITDRIRHLLARKQWDMYQCLLKNDNCHASDADMPTHIQWSHVSLRFLAKAAKALTVFLWWRVDRGVKKGLYLNCKPFYFLCARGIRGNYACLLLCTFKNREDKMFAHTAWEPTDIADGCLTTSTFCGK